MPAISWPPEVWWPGRGSIACSRALRAAIETIFIVILSALPREWHVIPGINLLCSIMYCNHSSPWLTEIIYVLLPGGIFSIKTLVQEPPLLPMEDDCEMTGQRLSLTLITRKYDSGSGLSAFLTHTEWPASHDTRKCLLSTGLWL